MKYLLIVFLLSHAFAAELKIDLDQWQGEWGEWQQKIKNGNDNKTYGGNLRINNCSTKDNTCRLSYDTKDVEQNECSGNDVVMHITSANLATADHPYNHEDCKIRLNLASGKNPPQISNVSATGKGCSAHCTDKWFIQKEYTLRSRKPYLTVDKICYFSKSNAIKEWCTRDDLQKLEQEYTSQYNRLSSIMHDGNSFQEMTAWRKQMFDRCESNQNPVECFTREYNQKKTNLASLITQAEKEKATKLAKLRDRPPIYKNPNFKIWERQGSETNKNEDPESSISTSWSIKDCTETGCNYEFESGNQSSVCSADGKFQFISKTEAYDLKEDTTEKDTACRFIFALSKDQNVDFETQGECNSFCGHSGAGALGGSFKKDAPSQKASFNCVGKLSLLEKNICDNADLSALDGKLAAVYRKRVKLAAKGDAALKLRGEQKEWLKQRNSKCTAADDKPACLKTTYEERIKALTP